MRMVITREILQNQARCFGSQKPRHITHTVQDTGLGFDASPGFPMAAQLQQATQGAHDTEDRARASGTSSSKDEPARTHASQSHLPRALSGQSGEGIGFSIVKGLCDLLDATLDLETKSGKGSTFRVTVPCRYDPERLIGAAEGEIKG